jgi:membrane protein DedA with SNARE-associated domain
MPLLDELLGGLPPLLVYVVVAVLVTAESAVVAGLVLPAATALIALGLLANAGTVQIVPALLVAVGAATLGGTSAFHSGRRRGPRVRATRLGRWIGDKRWNRAERLFTRHGGRAIFLGQWIVGARTLIPRLAGMNGTRYTSFAAWHTPAAALWSLWMVGASYLAGASYDLLAARAGRAGGALAALTTIVVVLILTGRWLGRHPRPFHSLARAPGASRLLNPVRRSRRRPQGTAGQRPTIDLMRGFGQQLPRRLKRTGFAQMISAAAGRGGTLPIWRRVRVRRPSAGPLVDLALGVVALFSLAAVLVVVMPVVVRFSGLADADVAITNWARSQWTSDGYLFALDAATFADPGVLLAVAAVVSVVRWWWMRHKRGAHVGLLTAIGPVLPIIVLAAAYSFAKPRPWETPSSVVFPAVSEFDGYIPFDAAGIMASRAVGHTAQLAAAVGLLVWMLAGHLRWKWRVTAWTAAAIYVVASAGSWVYLGWSKTSETVAAILIGAAWAALNAAIWSAPRKPAPAVEGVEAGWEDGHQNDRRPSLVEG